MGFIFNDVKDTDSFERMMLKSCIKEFIKGNTEDLIYSVGNGMFSKFRKNKIELMWMDRQNSKVYDDIHTDSEFLLHFEHFIMEDIHDYAIDNNLLLECAFIKF